MKRIIFSFVMVLGLLINSSCKKEEDYDLVFDDTGFETTDWTAITHSKSADPDYSEVFSDKEVKRHTRGKLRNERSESRDCKYNKETGILSDGNQNPFLNAFDILPK